MHVYRITLIETVNRMAEVEIMAEDEPTAQRIALTDPNIAWGKPESETWVEHVEEIIASNPDADRDNIRHTFRNQSAYACWSRH